MAILIIDKSICKLCNKILKEGDEVYSFTAFVANANDPLAFFNDEGFHRACLDNNKLAKKAIEFAEQNRMTKYCSIGNNLITNPDDYFAISLLSSDETEKVYKYNFLVFDKNNIGQWEGRHKLINDLSEYKNSGKWKDLSSYKYLDKLISWFS